MKALTERKRAIVEAVRWHIDQHGYAPSMRDIGDIVGLTSTSSVRHQVVTLVDAGFLVCAPFIPRSIRLGPAALNEQTAPAETGAADC